MLLEFFGHQKPSQHEAVPGRGVKPMAAASLEFSWVEERQPQNLERDYETNYHLRRDGIAESNLQRRLDSALVLLVDEV